MSAIDIILRERDDYRRQAAKLRQDVVSLHARLAALENDFDELKSENTNIKMRLARATEGRDTSQRSTTDGPSMMVMEDSDDGIQVIPSPAPNSNLRAVEADTRIVHSRRGIHGMRMIPKSQHGLRPHGLLPPRSARSMALINDVSPHSLMKRKHSISVVDGPVTIRDDGRTKLNKRIKVQSHNTKEIKPPLVKKPKAELIAPSSPSHMIVEYTTSEHPRESSSSTDHTEDRLHHTEPTDADDEDEDDLYGPSLSELDQRSKQPSFVSRGYPDETTHNTRHIKDGQINDPSSPSTSSAQNIPGTGLPSDRVDLSLQSRNLSSETIPSRRSSRPSQQYTAKRSTLEVEVVIPPFNRMSLHLRGCSDLKCDPPPLPALASRPFLAHQYGGSSRHFVVTFPAGKNPSSVNGIRHARHVLFPRRDMNPAMPQEAGAAGLLFASRHEMLSNPPWTVFIRMNPDARGLVQWKYFGEYECTRSAPMTPVEFATLTNEVKLNWAKSLVRNRKWDVYARMRARIYLRKANIPLTTSAESQELAKVKKKQGGKLSNNDIINALARGDEAIDIIKMRCVKYDHDFAQHIRMKWPEWVPPPKEKSKQSGPRFSARRGPSQRTRNDLISDAESSDLDVNMDLDQAHLAYGHLSVSTRSGSGTVDESAQPQESDISSRDYWSGSLTPLNDSEFEDRI